VNPANKTCCPEGYDVVPPETVRVTTPADAENDVVVFRRVRRNV
jgi:hypothetical protein